MSGSTSSFLRQAFSTFSTQVLLVILGLASGIIISRTLGPAGRGAYALLILIPSMAFRFGNLGLGSAATYWMNRGKVPHDRLASTLFMSGLVLSVISVLAFLALRPGRLTVYEDISTNLLLLAICTTPAVFLTTYGTRVLLGWKMVERMNLFRALQAVIFLSLVVVLLIGLDGRVREALIAFSGGSIFIAVLMTTTVLRRSGWSSQFDHEFLRQALIYGFPAFLYLLFNYLNHYFDVFLVKHFMANAQVGLYALAISWVDRFLYIPTALGTVLFPRVAEDEVGGRRDLVTRSARHGFALVLISMILFAAVVKPIILTLYGSDFAGSVPAIYSLMPGIALFTLVQVYGVAFAADGRPWVPALVSLTGFAIKVSLNLLWIPRWGIVGAGLATSTCYASMSVIMLITYHRCHGTGLREMILLHPTEARQTLQRIASSVARRLSRRNA